MFRRYPYTNFHDINLDWIIKRVKDLTNRVFKVETELDDFLDSVDITKDVSDKLNEMLENGDLYEIVNQAELMNFQKNATLSRVGRIIDNFNNPSDVVLGLQSILYHNDKYYTIGDIPSTDTTNISVYDNQGLLIINKPYEYGHGQGAAIFKDNLIVKNSILGNLSILNTNTLEVLGSIEYPTETCITITSDEDNLYIVGLLNEQVSIYRYDTLSWYKVCDITLKEGNVIQNILKYDNYFYLLISRSSQIIKIDSNGDIKYIYNIPDSDGYYYTGELEDIFIKDDNIYLYGAVYDPQLTYESARLGQIFATDILSPLNSNQYYSYYINEYPRYYNVNGDNVYEFNPTGNQFTYLDDTIPLVYKKPIHLRNITRGSFRNYGTEELSIIGFTNNITIDNIYTSGNYTIKGINTIKNLYSNYANGDVSVRDINNITSQSSSLSLCDTRLNNIASIKETTINGTYLNQTLYSLPTSSLTNVNGTTISLWFRSFTSLTDVLSDVLSGFNDNYYANVEFIGIVGSKKISIKDNIRKNELSSFSHNLNGVTFANNNGTLTYDNQTLSQFIDLSVKVIT